MKVVVRCRPLSRKEVEDQRKTIVEMNNKTGEVWLKNPDSDPNEQPKPYTFDQVYDSTTQQQFLFETTAKPIIDSVLQGYNGTVFAYGQTGTGKSHTMEGQWEPPELRGIIPRAFLHIFDQIECTHDQNFLVRASYLEIYNEEVRDLLSKDPKNRLDVKEDVERGVYVKDLTSYVVKGVTEMENVLLAGKKNRSVGATLMNQDSSRSHSIFTIVIESSSVGNDGEKHIKAGKLNLVDLAGSERQSKTGATGDRLKEATKINLSLSALGNVISALVDAKTSHIPYRDSKLTRLLQDSLGGNTKTVMVANLGPADYNYDETSSTLRYANRAKNIKNKPRINEDPKDAMLREFQEEIQRLKAALEKQGGKGGAGGGIGALGGAGGGGAGVRQMTNDELDEVNQELAKQQDQLDNAEKIRCGCLCFCVGECVYANVWTSRRMCVCRRVCYVSTPRCGHARVFFGAPLALLLAARTDVRVASQKWARAARRSACVRSKRSRRRRRCWRRSGGNGNAWRRNWPPWRRSLSSATRMRKRCASARRICCGLRLS